MNVDGDGVGNPVTTNSVPNICVGAAEGERERERER